MLLVFFLVLGIVIFASLVYYAERISVCIFQIALHNWVFKIDNNAYSHVTSFSATSFIGFNTTHTVVWCADRTRTQGSKITPQPQFYPQLILTFFYQLYGQKFFFKKISRIFFKNIEKKHTNKLWGWCAGVDNTTLKKAVVVRSAQRH